jgi:hypothetical protein
VNLGPTGGGSTTLSGSGGLPTDINSYSSLAPAELTDKLIIYRAGDGWGTYTVGDMPSGGGSSLTTEQIQDIVGAFVVSSGGTVAVTYNDAANVLDLSLVPEAVQDIVGAMLTSSDGSVGLSYDDNGGTYNLTVSAEFIQDTVAAMLTSSDSSVTITYNDATGKIDLKAAGAGGTSLSSTTVKARAAATGNVTVTNPGAAIFDGVTLTSGDYLLLMSQTTGSQNGVYKFNGSSAALTRAPEADSWGELAGCIVEVQEGTTNGDKFFYCTNDASSGTLGTTAVTFVTHASKLLAYPNDATKFLNGTGNWTVPAGGGGGGMTPYTGLNHSNSQLVDGDGDLIWQSGEWKAVTFGEKARAMTGRTFNVLLYGAKGAAQEAHDVVCNSGSTTVTAASGPFRPEHVGATIWFASVGGTFNPRVIGSVDSATQVTLTTASGSSQAASRALWGHDDTAAIQAALNAAKKQGTSARTRASSVVVLPPGNYLTGPLKIPQGVALMGYGPLQCQLWARPGNYKTSSATDTSGSGGSKAGRWDAMINMMDVSPASGYDSVTSLFLHLFGFGLDGKKHFIGGSGAGPFVHGIYFDTSKDTAGSVFFPQVGDYVDTYTRFHHIHMWDIAGNGLTYNWLRGESMFGDIGIYNSALRGVEINSFDLSLDRVNAGGSSKSGFYVSTASCRFANCKSFFNGKSATSGSPPDPGTSDRYANWVLEGAGRTDFIACHGQESMGDNWVIANSKYMHTLNLVGCTADDTACMTFQDTSVVSGATHPTIRAAFRFVGQVNDVVMNNCRVVAGTHNQSANNFKPNNWATHALYMDTNTGTDFNYGDIWVQRWLLDQSGQAAVGGNTPQNLKRVGRNSTTIPANDSLRINGVAIPSIATDT